MSNPFGEDHGLIHEVIVTGRRVGAGRKFYSRLAHNEDLFRRTVQFVLNDVCSVVEVVVDCNRSLAEMISAGKYDWVHSDITAEHFSVREGGAQEKEIALFHFGRNISSKDAICEMDAAGYRPAIIEELLALGESQPELQKQFSIVALGGPLWRDSGNGYHHVPCLEGDVGGRNLDLCRWFDGFWISNWRFAAVRK